MRPFAILLSLALVGAVAAGCEDDHDHPHGEETHEHEGEEAHGDHAHEGEAHGDHAHEDENLPPPAEPDPE